MLISTGITVLLTMGILWSVIAFFISEEEEVDKMMEQKLKEEEERKRKKEMEERMSLEETKEQVRLYDCCILILGLFTKWCCNYVSGLLSLITLLFFSD